MRARISTTSAVLPVKSGEYHASGVLPLKWFPSPFVPFVVGCGLEVVATSVMMLELGAKAVERHHLC